MAITREEQLVATQIARPDDVRRLNSTSILSAIRRDGTLSRTDIAARTSLSPSTVSAISAHLIGQGILVEGRGSNPAREDVSSGRRGRPQVLLSCNEEAATIGVVVLALNYLSVALVDYTGRIIAEEARRVPTLPANGDVLIDMIVGLLADLTAAHPADGVRLRQISMGVQGVTDARATTMLWSPIVGEKNIAFSSAIEERLGIPVTVSNDCAMIAEALRWIEPEHYSHSFAAVLLSHGIGMGLYLNGRPFAGLRSSAAEFGHMRHIPGGARCRCGRLGCIEAYAGDYAIWRTAKGLHAHADPASDIAASDIAGLAEEARNGCREALRAFSDAGRAIGYGLSSLFSMTDPVPVALIGHGAAALDLIEDEIRNAVGESTSWDDAHDIAIRVYPDEFPLIRLGCIMTSLLDLDTKVSAIGEDTMPLSAQRGG